MKPMRLINLIRHFGFLLDLLATYRVNHPGDAAYYIKPLLTLCCADEELPA